MRRAVTPWLGPEGFAFRLDETARYFAACDGDYVVPFGTMRPYRQSFIRFRS